MAIEHNSDAHSSSHESLSSPTSHSSPSSHSNSEHEATHRNQETSQGAPQDAHQISSDAQSGVSGRGWHGNPEGHAAAGRKGGQKVARDREHMAAIGRKGGEAVSRDRQHMAEIGRKGGQSRGETTTAERTS